MGSRSGADSSVDPLWRTMVPHWGSRDELGNDGVPSGLRIRNGCEEINEALQGHLKRWKIRTIQPVYKDVTCSTKGSVRHEVPWSSDGECML